MLCKVCRKIETDTTDGICWRCCAEGIAIKLRQQGHYAVIVDRVFRIKCFFKGLCGLLWKHQIVLNKEGKEQCCICKKIIH